jgi:hypothetical protein
LSEIKKGDTDNKKLQAMLENLELTGVQMPAHQRRLRDTLLVSGYFEKRKCAFLGATKNIRRNQSDETDET